jgi:hypothetical protein
MYRWNINGWRYGDEFILNEKRFSRAGPSRSKAGLHQLDGRWYKPGSILRRRRIVQNRSCGNMPNSPRRKLMLQKLLKKTARPASISKCARKDARDVRYSWDWQRKVTKIVMPKTVP